MKKSKRQLNDKCNWSYVGCKSVSYEASILKVRDMCGACGAKRVDSHAMHHARQAGQ